MIKVGLFLENTMLLNKFKKNPTLSMAALTRFNIRKQNVESLTKLFSHLLAADLCCVFEVYVQLVWQTYSVGDSDFKMYLENIKQ